ncbi:MAG TPA: sulfite exporter TauE/SafE family protein, partial [Burkholderiaceae bacterium]|nr:sulfite exporter TauE/SafE family protein [Burkholderiaceae bacterium]
MIWIAAYLLAGAGVGFLAGLLGIGGGMTLVPILAALFAAQGLAPEHTVHLALGTGMASILFTSSASVREHHRHQAVDWRIVSRMAPGMVVGTLLSTLAAGWVSQQALALAFALIVY